MTGPTCSFRWPEGAAYDVRVRRIHLVDVAPHRSQRWEFEARFTWKLARAGALLHLNVVQPRWQRTMVGNHRDQLRRDALDPLLAVPPPVRIQPDGVLVHVDADPPDRFPRLPAGVDEAARRSWERTRSLQVRAGRIADTWQQLVQRWATSGHLPAEGGQTRVVTTEPPRGRSSRTFIEEHARPLDDTWWEVHSRSTPDSEQTVARTERTLNPAGFLPVVVSSDTETQVTLTTRPYDLRPRELRTERTMTQEVLPPGASATVRGVSRDVWTWHLSPLVWPG